LRNHKGQISSELLLGVGIIMALFILISIFSLNKQIDLKKRNEQIDKRDECLKFANLINSVYINGPGTEVKTKTKYLITTFNSSLISISDLENISENKIAILVSESGPSNIDFYNKANSQLNPDWYKVCFADIGNSSNCDAAPWIDSNINNTLDILLENINNYTTIYLENPNLHENNLQILEEWVSQGNSLIISRHLMCREQSTGTYPNTSYKCNPDGTYNNDRWHVFNVLLYQKDSAWGYPKSWNVEVNQSNEAFALFPGDKLSFKNRPYVISSGALDFTSIAKYINKTCLLSFCLEDSANKPAIALWKYGYGRVYYLGDFETEFINPPGNDFSDIIIHLISIAPDLILRPEQESDIICSVSSKTYYQHTTGNLKIKNKNNVIVFEND
jgi:hypothetical protein